MRYDKAEELAREIDGRSGWCALIEEDAANEGYLVRAWDYGSRRRHGVHVFRSTKHWREYSKAREKAATVSGKD